jgi:hypothetical protein
MILQDLGCQIDTMMLAHHEVFGEEFWDDVGAYIVQAASIPVASVCWHRPRQLKHELVMQTSCLQSIKPAQ